MSKLFPHGQGQFDELIPLLAAQLDTAAALCPLAAGSVADASFTYRYTSPDGKSSDKKFAVKNKREHLSVSEPGIYSLMGIEGPCAGEVMEPSKCEVQMVPLPSMDMSVETLHEWYIFLR